MSVHEILITVMGIFALLGGIDRMLGGHWGLGAEFQNGILAMGSLALAMLGVICAAPVLAGFLQPAVVPVFRLLGADPAMFAGTILACDMGGAALAQQMAQSQEAALFGGVLCGSMMGATLVFTIPVALGILEETDRPYLAKGILAGVITIPAGLLAGGLTAGFPLSMILRNLLPVVLLAAAIAVGLFKRESAMIRGFAAFGKGITALITFFLALAVFQELSGIRLLPGLAPLSEGFQTVGSIAVILAGAFPLVHLLVKILKKPLSAVGRLLGINESAAAGLLASLANSIAAFGMLPHMDARGKVINIAFSVSAAFVFGDHLGFTAGFAPQMLPALIVGKLVGGLGAIGAALLLTGKER